MILTVSIQRAGSTFFPVSKEHKCIRNFMTREKGLPDLPEVRFFTESILEKQNRSKMRFHKDSTPFLADRSDDVVGIYNPPVPSVRGLPEGKRYRVLKIPCSQH